MKKLGITKHGEKLWSDLQTIREEFEEVCTVYAQLQDLLTEKGYVFGYSELTQFQDRINEQYHKKAQPYESDIIEELFDANNNQTRKPKLIQMHNEGLPASLDK